VGDVAVEGLDIVPAADHAFPSVADRGLSDGDGSYLASVHEDPYPEARFLLEPTAIADDRAITLIAVRARARDDENAGTNGMNLGIYVPSWDAAYGDPIYDSGALSLGTSYGVVEQVMEQQPWEDRPWTAAELDEIQVAVKPQADGATGGQVRVTQVWMEICHSPP
jgi:hypothetical protein